MATYANFTDSYVPEPLAHRDRRIHAFPAAADAHNPKRIVIAAFDNAHEAMADGRWLSMDVDHVRPVSP